MASETDFLRRAVSIYSPSTREQEAAGFFVGEMKKLGFNSHVDDAGNAIGEIGSGERTILMAGHIDTVPGEIPVRIENGRLFGRGSVDAKGPFAAFVLAASRARPARARIIVAGCVEEEYATSKGARNLIGRYNPDFIVIGEPSGAGSITLGYKGRLLLDYENKREISHRAGKDPGVIEDAINFYTGVRDYCNAYNSSRNGIFDMLQATVREMNSASDGFTDTVRMTVAFRWPTGFDIQGLKNHMLSSRESAEIRLYAEEAPIRSEKNNMLVRAFVKAIRDKGIAPTFKYKTGTSDMNVLGHAFPGIPIIAYGPGDSSLDHTPGENIEIQEFLKGIDVLVSALDSL